MAVDLDGLRNSHFVPDAWAEVFRAQLGGMALQLNRAGFALSSTDLLEIERAEQTIETLVVQHFDTMRRLATARRARLLAGDQPVFISLGEDCLARTVLAQWGLKRPAALGERSGPFDLSVHPTASLLQLLETDFEAYLQDDDLSFVPELDYCVNTRLNISFNHELGEEMARDGFARLKQIYQRRIAYFEATCRTAPELVFVHHVPTHDPEVWASLPRLREALARRRDGLDFQYVVVSSGGKASPEAADRRLDAFEDVTIIDVEKPWADYVWHLPSQSFSPEGVAFESRIVEGVEKAVSLMRERAAARRDAA